MELLAFGAVGENQIGRRGERAGDDGADFTGRGVHGGDGGFGHVGDVERAIRRNGEVVERGMEGGDDGDRLGLHVDLLDLAGLGVDGVEIAIGAEVRGGGDLEAGGDDRVLAVLGIDFHDGVLEPERAVDHAVRPDLEAVEAAEVLADQARGLLARDIGFVKRVAEEDLREVELAVLREGQRVRARQALRDHARLATLVLDEDLAREIAGPRHLAVRTKRNVIGHAVGRA